MVKRSLLLCGVLATSIAASGEAAAASPAPSLSPTIVDALGRGLVVVERDKKPVAVGTVLRGDGRVVTALSALGDVKGAEPALELRFPDGSMVKAKLGHQDGAWDLALLVPQSGRYNEGLVAGETDPTSVPLFTAMPSKTKSPFVSSVPVRGRTDARGKGDASALNQAIDLDTRGVHVVPGSPLVDAQGSVLGLVVNACRSVPAAPNAAPMPCSPVSVGAPVSALRNFLVRTPASAKRPSAWLGIAGAAAQVASTRGVRVLATSPGSPAEKAGFHVSETDGDVIVAVDGTPVDSPESLAAEVSKHAVGESVKVLTLAGGKYREVMIALGAAPLHL